MESRTTSLTLDRKGRLEIEPSHPPRQRATERVANWREVFLGFDPESAINEASRCIQCPGAPCMVACPLHNDIPGALWLIEHGDPGAAGDVFRRTSNMPEICSRVCPQEKLCEGACAVGRNGAGRPVQIGKLEQFCADYLLRNDSRPARQVDATQPTIAVVGAGPAGLAAAEELALVGHPVTVYDAWPVAGGNLRYGIPSFKLDKSLIDARIARLEALGVSFRPNARLGVDITVDDLLKVNAAVFLAYGASGANRLGVPGEELPGVYSATEFLVRANLDPADRPAALQAPLSVGSRVTVIGGGDTAMDCVRSALRLGVPDVACVYRRSEAEMPGRIEERRYARDEGAEIHFLAAPIRILGDGQVSAVEFIRMGLAEPDQSGRRSVRPIEGSEFTIPADMVVVAAGYRVEDGVLEVGTGIDTGRGAIVVVDAESGRTSRPGVFAGGDLTTGASLVVTAVAAGRRAARAIHESARSESFEPRPSTVPPRHLNLTTLRLWRDALTAEAERLAASLTDVGVEGRRMEIEFELELIDDRLREIAHASD